MQSIDFLNARRASKPASGGKNQRNVDSKTEGYRRADLNAQWRAMDTLDQIVIAAEARVADFIAWNASRPTIDQIVAELEARERDAQLGADDWFR